MKVVAGTRRGGKSRTRVEREERHESLYGSRNLPERGRGLFCRRLEAIIADEATAKTDYDRLLTYAPTGTVRQIKGIQRDEQGHRKKLIKMQDRYCR